LNVVQNVFKHWSVGVKMYPWLQWFIQQLEHSVRAVASWCECLTLLFYHTTTLFVCLYLSCMHTQIHTHVYIHTHTLYILALICASISTHALHTFSDQPLFHCNKDKVLGPQHLVLARIRDTNSHHSKVTCWSNT